ncbi:UNVERIFIED_ORG: hypothetical protein [Escherichia phage CMSTMSU]
MPIRGVPEPLMEVIKHVRIGDREVNLRRNNIFTLKLQK